MYYVVSYGKHTEQFEQIKPAVQYATQIRRAGYADVTITLYGIDGKPTTRLRAPV